MKRLLLATGMALALGAAPIAAQTHVSVAVGFGVPRPYVTGVVIVGRPHVYRYRPSLLVARRGYVARHRRHHHAYDDDYDGDND